MTSLNDYERAPSVAAADPRSDAKDPRDLRRALAPHAKRAQIEFEDGVVFHTYSAYGRGVDGLWGMYAWLDRAPLGRNESGAWWRRHDEYEGG